MGFISGNITNFSQSGLFFFFLPLSLSLSRGKYFTSAGEGEKDTARPLLSTCKDTKVIASASVTTVGLERRAEWKKKKLHDDWFGCAPLGKQGSEWNDVCIRDHQRPIMSATQHSHLGTRQPMDWWADWLKKNLEEKTSQKPWVVRRLEYNNKGKISVYTHIYMCVQRECFGIKSSVTDADFFVPTCILADPPPLREHPRAVSWTSALH